MCPHGTGTPLVSVLRYTMCLSANLKIYKGRKLLSEIATVRKPNLPTHEKAEITKIGSYKLVAVFVTTEFDVVIELHVLI